MVFCLMQFVVDNMNHTEIIFGVWFLAIYLLVVKSVLWFFLLFAKPVKLSHQPFFQSPFGRNLVLFQRHRKNLVSKFCLENCNDTHAYVVMSYLALQNQQQFVHKARSFLLTCYSCFLVVSTTL